LGNTFYFDFPGLSIPFYQLDAGRIILLDGGYARNAGQILEYLHGNEIRIEAILHTHAHPDHINGDHVFLGQFSPDPEIFCSQRDFEFMLGRRRENEKEISEHDEYQNEDNLAYLEALIGKIQDIGDKEAVTICGKTFRLLSSTGHCLQHQAIVTPDDVCYLGDLLLHPDLSIVIAMLEADEYRPAGQVRSRRRRGALNGVERIPTAFVGEMCFDCPDDYRQLIPEALPDRFTMAQFSSAAGFSSLQTSGAIKALLKLGVIAEDGREGRSRAFVKSGTDAQ